MRSVPACLLVLVLAASSCTRPAHTPSASPSMPQAAVGAWIDLLDNPGTRWRGYRQPGFPQGWAYDPETRILTLSGRGGDLITRDQFGDFELYLEWMVEPRGNSGVFFHATEATDRIYENAPEAQILDNQLHPEGANPLTAAGANYALHSTRIDAAYYANYWNKALIRVQGAHVEHWLNGNLVVSYELWTDGWRELVAKSKFAQWPSYGLARRGHIGLQDHGNVVSFRNIQIRELTP